MPSLLRTRLGQALGTALGGALALGTYATLIEPHWLAVTRTRVTVPGLPPELDGLRLALLTDLHAGGITRLPFIRRACRRAMADEPHLIACTGDLVSDADDPLEAVVDLLDAELHAPLGVYAVPGNHDHKAGIDRWQAALAKAQTLTDLTNRAVVRVHAGHPLWIGGVDDLGTGAPDLADALPSADAAACTLLLAHNPDHAERLCHDGWHADLVLSGHTHGGQVRFPFVGALRMPIRHQELYAHGLQTRPWAQVYVSRGVGTVHLPVRFGCRPEVALLELVPGPAG